MNKVDLYAVAKKYYGASMPCIGSCKAVYVCKGRVVLDFYLKGSKYCFSDGHLEYKRCVRFRSIDSNSFLATEYDINQFGGKIFCGEILIKV